MVRTLKKLKYEVVGLDICDSPSTSHLGSIIDRSFVSRCLDGVKTAFHTATLHKPHIVTHGAQAFVDTNITGTLNLLQESIAVEHFVFTSTTSVFGAALLPPPGAPAAWVTEDVAPVPKNSYGITKLAAEQLGQLFHRNHGLACIILRTSRFFPEEDDDRAMRESYASDNLQVNEFSFRRVDPEDAVDAHLLAAQRAHAIGFGTYIISAAIFTGRHR
jgi:UDP-glucose 4-epimerase